MLRTNLSTRPFYNERAVHLVLVVAGLLVLGLTIFNFVQILTLSRTQTELRGRAERQEARARELNERAVSLRRGLDNDRMKTIVAAAAQANALIDQRTFSWTELFNRIETTLPGDVMLVSLRPELDKGETYVSMVVIGRRVDDIDAFMERLEETGGFAGVLSRQEEMTEGGGYRAVLRGRYVEGGSPRPLRISRETVPPAWEAADVADDDELQDEFEVPDPDDDQEED